MTKTKWFYEKNQELMSSHVNKTFDELLMCSEDEFRQWVIDLRKVVVDLWDNKGIPPRVGYNQDEIIDNFKKMFSYPVHEFIMTDELTGNDDVIRNTSTVGNAVNQWFPTMMKTKISYSSKGNPKSIYDYFADDSLLDTFVTYAKRHFRRDSFYHYSSPISVGDIIDVGFGPYRVTTAEDFVKSFRSSTHDYWLCPVKENKKYTGYNKELATRQNVIVTADFDVPAHCKTNVDKDKTNAYTIRLYKKGQKVFPIGLKAFRVSFCQYAVNFPPLTARYLYEKFISHISKDQDKIIIYDPSSGWGGRLLGAMSINDSYSIHYVGTDPNTDHDTINGRRKYHEIADFFNENVRRRGVLFASEHSYEIFSHGSEVIHEDPKFQKYKGKLDLVFTSPPYFNKEVYSNDAAQSCHKFTSYDAWRDGFLRPTLTTAVEYLRSDRYLLWNIADIALDGKLLSLEDDSRKILEELGMKYVTTLKMTLAQMPGGNRQVETGDMETVVKRTVFGEETEEISVTKGMMKNFCEIKSDKKKMMLKYEPVFVFHKP
jgi:hypothetical protein